MAPPRTHLTPARRCGICGGTGLVCTDVTAVGDRGYSVSYRACTCPKGEVAIALAQGRLEGYSVGYTVEKAEALQATRYV